MISVDEAIEAVLRQARPLPARGVPLDSASIGLILAEDIVADIDLPPFDKALMDGYAVRSSDLAISGFRKLRVVEEITAGRVPLNPVWKGEASRIMTGAPLPSGADAVVAVERSKLDGPNVVLPGPVSPGQNRLLRGKEMKAGEVLLASGTRLDAAKLGLIASAGRDAFQAIPRPTVSVVPTGDELVPASRKPGPGQIRNTNGPTLAGLVRTWSTLDCRECPIAPDLRPKLREALARELGLDGSTAEPVDVLLISGGVSAGTMDLIPSTLVDLGIRPIFHGVHVRPGKPLWFGVGPGRGFRPGTLVFGLPGNPVSGIVGFLLFVRPALEVLAGLPPKRTQLASFPLGAPFEHKGDRPTYHPAQLQDGQILPLKWAGSADLRAVALADGFAAFPAGDRSYRAGEPVPFLPLK